jgi:hypothetical protein
MKKMEGIEGGRPTNEQFICWGVSVVYGFIHPVMGIVSGFACLWA